MRVALIAGAALASLAAAPGEAATIIVFAHPETLERRLVLVDPNGPDRAYLCMLPPGEAGCRQLRVGRRPR